MEGNVLIHLALIIFTLNAAIYIAFLCILNRGLKKLILLPDSHERPFVSVIVPVRNEEKYINKCIQHLTTQSYPPEKYEIIFINDDSSDSTHDLVQLRTNHQLKLLQSKSFEGLSPKKAALHTGIIASRGEIILTTDADCMAPPTWIETMVSQFRSDTALVASWVVVQENEHFLSRIEALDSLGFVLVGAAAFGLNHPFLANGANLAYRKSAYFQVNGFDQIGHFGSGDDDLLLQKMKKLRKWKCVFAASMNAGVITHANRNLNQFFKQRLRWASKAAIYPRSILWLQLWIYFFHLCLFVSAILLIFIPPAIIFPLMKIAADFFFFKNNARKAARSVRVIPLVGAELLQWLYLIIIGIWSNWGRYSWKGRAYVHGKVETKAFAFSEFD
ncbi:MAG: glycosyltransferase [Calditrichaeota bacterium]|nr:MAG: glycosyltransferase [Calditrichota bacterium]